MKITNLSFTCLGASVLLIGQATTANADVLYSQPTDFNGGFFSQNDTNLFGNYATTYDNFTLATSATVNNVEWTGSYANPAAQGTITAFTISFWADSAGQPDTSPIFSQSISGNANETFIQNDNFAAPTYSYSANLSPVFTALAGTQYWLSIVPDLGAPPQWAWETATGGDGIAYQDFFGSRSQIAVDLAFNLNGEGTGVSVPEPGSLTLMGLGLASVGGLGWMKKKRV